MFPLTPGHAATPQPEITRKRKNPGSVHKRRHGEQNVRILKNVFLYVLERRFSLGRDVLKLEWEGIRTTVLSEDSSRGKISNLCFNFLLPPPHFLHLAWWSFPSTLVYRWLNSFPATGILIHHFIIILDSLIHHLVFCSRDLMSPLRPPRVTLSAEPPKAMNDSL